MSTRGDSKSCVLYASSENTQGISHLVFL